MTQGRPGVFRCLGVLQRNLPQNPVRRSRILRGMTAQVAQSAVIGLVTQQRVYSGLTLLFLPVHHYIQILRCLAPTGAEQSALLIYQAEVLLQRLIM